jgi:hypothetical protein
MHSQVMKKTTFVEVTRLRAKQALAIMARFHVRALHICNPSPEESPLFLLSFLLRKYNSIGVCANTHHRIRSGWPKHGHWLGTEEHGSQLRLLLK